jgi:hypothetical protein
MISFKQISEYINSGEVFECTVVTYDRKRKTGGKLLHIKGVLAKGVEQGGKLRAMTRGERVEAQLKTNRRNPNHHRWYTRNVRLVTLDGFLTNELRKIHLPLIVKFNGQTVMP